MSAPANQTAVPARGRRLRDLSRWLLRTPRGRLLLAGLALIEISIFANIPPHELRVSAHPAFPSLAWWLSPVDSDPDSRLQRIDCDLRAVFARDADRIWVAGAFGFVARTEDGGRTWIRETIDGESVGGRTREPVSVPDAAAAATTPPAVPLPDPLPYNGGDRRTPHEGGDKKAREQKRAPASKSGGESSSPSHPKASLFDGLLEGVAYAVAAPPAPAPAPAPADADSSPPPRPRAGADLIAIQLSGDTRYLVDEDAFTFVTGREPRRSSPSGMKFPLRYARIISLSAIFTELAMIDDSGLRWIVSIKDNNRGSRVQVSRGEAPSSTDSHEAVFAEPRADSSNSPLWSVTVGRGGLVRWSTPSGETNHDDARPAPVTSTLRGLFFFDESAGFIVGDDGVVLSTADRGRNFSVQLLPSVGRLNNVDFLGDRRHGFIVGDRGVVLGTDDGGVNWHRLTRAWSESPKVAAGLVYRYPAPWLYLALVAAGLMVFPALRKPPPPPSSIDESVADVLVSDRPLERPEDDRLSLNDVALGVSRFLRNENTAAPLTIAVSGEWGSGKSSLMSLIRADLRRYRFRPVWFNAWHHQKEEHMLAALLQNIRLQAVPAWLSREGILFRLHLLWIRGWRRWLPIVALLFVLAFSLAYEATYGPKAGLDRLAGLYTELRDKLKDGGKLSDALRIIGTKGSILGIVGSALGLFETLRRCVKAFGVKPATLLAGVSSAARVVDLEAKTSFRQRFAGELQDVTRALGERSMIIFIDDLDRCRPDQVVETLEAVNFVVSSGDCYVIMGMAPARVEPCVAIYFKEVAQEIPSLTIDGKRETPRQKRSRFAREYLDKLINIEVPVPTLSVLQAERLLPPDETPATVVAPARAQRWSWAQPRVTWSAVVTAVARRQRLWPVLAIALLVLAGGVAGRSCAGRAAESEFAAREVSIPAALSASGMRERRVVAPASPTLPSPAPVAPVEQRSRAGQSPAITPGHHPIAASMLVAGLALIALLIFGVRVILTRRPDLIVKDSGAFTRALHVWHDVVFDVRRTPRAFKRFLNRVRYLAMRQRRLGGDFSLWERVIDGKAAAPDTQSSPPPAENTIPEPTLVALAALHEIIDVNDAERFAALGRTLSAAPHDVDRPGAAGETKLRRVWAKHVEKFGITFDDLARCRELYLARVQGIRVS